MLLALYIIPSPISNASWRNGTGEQTLLGSSQAALIGTNSFNSIVSPLDSLLATYCNQFIQYLSSSTLTITAGSVTVSNSGATIRLMLQNTGATTLTWGNIDTGSQQASTTYYVYAIGATNASTSATYLISANSSSPSGATYYYQIGSFGTDGSTNIIPGSIILNYIPKQPMLGTWSSKSANTIYQASTDGFAIAVANTGNSNSHFAYLYSDSSASPSTLRAEVGSDGSVSGPNGVIGTLFSPIRKGDYYEFTTSGSSISTAYFISSGS